MAYARAHTERATTTCRRTTPRASSVHTTSHTTSTSRTSARTAANSTRPGLLGRKNPRNPGLFLCPDADTDLTLLGKSGNVGNVRQTAINTGRIAGRSRGRIARRSSATYSGLPHPLVSEHFTTEYPFYQAGTARGSEARAAACVEGGGGARFCRTGFCAL